MFLHHCHPTQTGHPERTQVLYAWNGGGGGGGWQGQVANRVGKGLTASNILGPGITLE